MARCKLTRMSLRNIRKDKQYQCIVIDFVRTGVISKSKAEELLNYTIPAGLLEGSVAAPDDDEDEPGTGDNPGTGTGGEGTGGEGTGGEGTGGETAESVTLAVNFADMHDELGVSSPISSASGVADDGWLFVSFPLPEDPENRWLVSALSKENIYNTELLSAMYDTVKNAVVATGKFTAEDFESYFAPTTDFGPHVPLIVVANEDYQIGEDAWNSRFTVFEAPDELADGMILSYTPLLGGGSSEVVPGTN